MKPSPAQKPFFAREEFQPFVQFCPLRCVQQKWYFTDQEVIPGDECQILLAQDLVAEEEEEEEEGHQELEALHLGDVVVFEVEGNQFLTVRDWPSRKTRKNHNLTV